MREQRMTLNQIVETLTNDYNVSTSIGTLSRFLKQASPAYALRKPTPEGGRQIDAMALFVELLTEIKNGREENRMAIEQLAAQLRIQSEQFGDQADNQTQPFASAPSKKAKSNQRPFLFGLGLGLLLAVSLFALGVAATIYFGWGATA